MEAILSVWKSEGWVEPQLIEDTNLNQVTLVMKMERKSDENVIENVVEISEKPSISIDELRIALDVTDRTIARYISELKNKGIIERKGPDNGGKWKIL